VSDNISVKEEKRKIETLSDARENIQRITCEKCNPLGAYDTCKNCKNYLTSDEFEDFAIVKINDQQKEIDSLKEERVMLRKIAYAYKNLDCHSHEWAVDEITRKGWQAQLAYEKWCEKNGKDVGFPDWRELEKELKK
jgi:RNA polymerase subunit RPABC4/transcription elongation factor Spt4